MPECVRQGWCRCEAPRSPDTGFCDVCQGRHAHGIYKSRYLDGRRHEIWWCEACQARYALLAWAEQHRFPTLEVPPYIIAAGEERVADRDVGRPT